MIALLAVLAGIMASAVSAQPPTADPIRLDQIGPNPASGERLHQIDFIASPAAAIPCRSPQPIMARIFSSSNPGVSVGAANLIPTIPMIGRSPPTGETHPATA